MKRLQGRIRSYEWGGARAIPALFGLPEAEGSVAEVWLGAHHDDSASILDASDTPLLDPSQLYPSRVAPAHAVMTLDEYVATAPQAILGESVARRYDGNLPYLLKLIAPQEPLSLQVHPNMAQAREGYAAEDARHIERTARERSYRDTNHKPELALALTRFEALAGFRTARRIHGVLGTLGTELSDEIDAVVSRRGVAEAFRVLLSAHTRPTPEQVEAVTRACASRDPADSPSPRADAVVARLGRRHPGDPGVVASLLLNPVTLNPGEALYIPAGTVHAYLSGTAVEVMAASDNVVRAGLTAKHVNVDELLRIIDPQAAPPIRIAPERVSRAVQTFYAPVDDFELSTIHLHDASTFERIRTTGPRTLVCLEGAAQVRLRENSEDINAGQAVFLPDSDGPMELRGFGYFVLASVP